MYVGLFVGEMFLRLVSFSEFRWLLVLFFIKFALAVITLVASILIGAGVCFRVCCTQRKYIHTLVTYIHTE